MSKTRFDMTCVQVFGKISASISHEIKNTLSIINENAGLLDDFAQMSKEGGEGVSVERVFTATRAIAKQVDRSNTIMKDLNRFAHSADSIPAHGNLEETLTLLVALSNRQAAMRNITVTLDCPPDITISTSLIELESLIYLTLLTLYQKSAEGSVLSIKATHGAPSITLCFNAANISDLSQDTYPDAYQQHLAGQVGASFNLANNQLSMIFPAVIE